MNYTHAETVIPTRFGRLHALCSDRGVELLTFGKSFPKHARLLKGKRDMRATAKPHDFSMKQKMQVVRLKRSLGRFPARTGLNTAKLSMVLSGTPFQKKVWRLITRIAPGETLTYQELARKAGKPRAIRATASACGANPIALLIPCHRVVGSRGNLGGYAGGIGLKRKLLRYEGVR